MFFAFATINIIHALCAHAAKKTQIGGMTSFRFGGARLVYLVVDHFLRLKQWLGAVQAVMVWCSPYNVYSHDV